MGIFLLRKNMLRCPKCGGIFDKTDGDKICFECGCTLITEDEYQSHGYHPDRPTVECPYCHSTNTEPIKYDFLERSIHRYTLGVDIEKTGKQFHCNSCNANF